MAGFTTERNEPPQLPYAAPSDARVAYSPAQPGGNVVTAVTLKY